MNSPYPFLSGTAIAVSSRPLLRDQLQLSEDYCMNFRSLTTRFLIVISALCAFAFAGDENSFYFTIASNRIYTPGDPETAVEFNGNAVGKGTIYLRAFRIKDPVEFFQAQADPHAPTLRSLSSPNTF